MIASIAVASAVVSCVVGIRLLLQGTGGGESAAERTQIAQLSQSLEIYKARYGSYPPNFDDPIIVDMHVRYAFPEFGPDSTPPPRGLDAAEALVFWLRARSRDPRDPFGPGARQPALYDFDFQRLVDRDDDGYEEYVPFGKQSPLVYFYSGRYDKVSYSALRPYKHTRSDQGRTIETYVNDDSYQVVSAGADDEFGRGEDVSSVLVHGDPGADNFVSFCFTELAKYAQDRARPDSN
jgi:hypothetical protein